MPDFPDGLPYDDGGYFFYVPSRMMFNQLVDFLDDDYKLKLIDDEDDYYIYEVSKK